jgi:hypothetical protein
MHTVPAAHNRPPALSLAGLVTAAIVSAVIPAVVGLAFLISLTTRRPLIAVAAHRWPWLAGRPAVQPPRRTLTGLTAIWAIGMLAAAAIQLAGAFTGRLPLTSPGGFSIRTLIALAVEAFLAAITIGWLRRSPAPSPQPEPTL